MIETLWTETLAFLSVSSTLFEPLVPLGLALVSLAYVTSPSGSREASNNSVVVVCWIMVLCTASVMVRQGSLSLPERVGGSLFALSGTLLFAVSPQVSSNLRHRARLLGGLMLASVAAWSGSVAYMAGALPLVSLAWIFAVPVAHLLSRSAQHLFLPKDAGIPKLEPRGEPQRLGYGRSPSTVLIAGIALLSGGIGIASIDNAVPDHWASIGYVLLLAGHILFSLLETRRVAKTKRAGERQALQDEDAHGPVQPAHASLVRLDDELAASSLDPVPAVTPSVSDQHTSRVLNSLKWSFLGELSAKAITPVVFIVLARLLTPEDFGVMSAAAMVIAFSQIFWEAGMGKALIQRQTDVQDAANVVFWVNLALGCVISTLLYGYAEPIASTFFHDSRVKVVLRVMTAQVLLGALSSVQTALLQKEMSFRSLSWVRLTTVGIPGLASIPLAWNGLGYWALVGGSLLGQVAQVSMLWRMSDWRPSWHFRFGLAKQMLGFSIWVGCTALLGWLYTWLDAIFITKYLSIAELGIFRTGASVSTVIYGLLITPILPVLYSQFSKIHLSRARFEVYVVRVAVLITTICLPVGFLVVLFSGLLERVIFSEQWSGIAMVIAIVALKDALLYPFSTFIEGYRASGRPGIETAINSLAMSVSFPVYFLSISYGFSAFLIGRLLVGVLGVLVHTAFLSYVLRRDSRTFFLPYLKLVVVLSATGLVIYFTGPGLLTNSLSANALIGVVLLCAGTIIYRLERSSYVFIFARIRNRLC